MTAATTRKPKLTATRRQTRKYVSGGGRATDGCKEIPAADYSDEVSEAHFSALNALVAAEFEGETFELVSGPAW